MAIQSDAKKTTHCPLKTLGVLNEARIDAF